MQAYGCQQVVFDIDQARMASVYRNLAIIQSMTRTPFDHAESS